MFGSYEILTGDWRKVSAGLPDGRFHMCVTSPPYYQKQIFAWGGDENCNHCWPSPIPFDAGCMECQECGARAGTLGLEPSPEDFIASLVEVGRGVWRVLRDDGIFWLNLGDTYSYTGRGSNPAGSPHQKQRTNEGSITALGLPRRVANLPRKNLIGIPWRVALALQQEGWNLRDCVVWDKMRPMPGSQVDRCTNTYEFVFMLTKSQTYYFDAEAIREQQVSHGLPTAGDLRRSGSNNGEGLPEGVRGGMPSCVSEGGRMPRNIWRIAPRAGKSRDSRVKGHFATYPRGLPMRCIRASTSEKGCCSACGAQMRRGDDGWARSCDCDAASTRCRVLDPFLGHGTTAIAACLLGRDCTGCEISDVYAETARSRIERELRPGTFVDEDADVDAPLFQEQHS